MLQLLPQIPDDRISALFVVQDEVNEHLELGLEVAYIVAPFIAN